MEVQLAVVETASHCLPRLCPSLARLSVFPGVRGCVGWPPDSLQCVTTSWRQERQCSHRPAKSFHYTLPSPVPTPHPQHQPDGSIPAQTLKISAQPDPLLRMPSSDQTPPILQAQFHHLPEMPWSPQPHSAREYIPTAFQNQTWPAALSPLAVQSSSTQAGTPVPPGATSAGPAHREVLKVGCGVEEQKAEPWLHIPNCSRATLEGFPCK